MSAKRKNILYYGLLLAVFIISFFLIKNKPITAVNYKTMAVPPPPPPAEKIKTPKYVRGIYLTAYSAGNDTFRKNIIARIESGRINTVVVDIKDYSGYVLYDSQLSQLKKIKATKKQLADVRQVIDDFHKARIYVIARQTVFQDPMLAEARPELAFHNDSGALWRDRKGLGWIDPSKHEVWQYNLDIAKEAARLGFDEINFDYMRYPSDGDLGQLNYNLPEGQTKSEVMKNFYKFMSDNLSEKTPISIDMFGLVMDNANNNNYDLGIGQKLVNATDYFDYICPMMYPSHYADNYLGLANPADYPAEVIRYGIATSAPAWADKRATLRPWLQAFSIGAVYDETKIEAQIKETENASTTGWLLWNARNVYADFIFTK